MYEGNESRIEVYKNPDYGHGHIYDELNIPIYNSCEDMPMSMSDSIETEHLRLRRCRCSIHVTYEMLADFLQLGAIEGTEALANILHHVSIETQHTLRRLQPISEGHPVILQNVWMIQQHESRLMLIDITFWAVQERDADLGKDEFYRLFFHTLQHGYTVSGNLNDTVQIHDISFTNHPMYGISPVDFSQKKLYNDDAEENAHELLKSMITKKQFELYKKDNYVIIKGTKGRKYKVNKNEMIAVAVSECELTRRKKTSYRLCIEPRDRDTICPTDEVIAKIKLIRADEKLLHKLANKFDNNFGSGISLTFNGTMDSISITNSNDFNVSVSRDGGQTFTECTNGNSNDNNE